MGFFASSKGRDNEPKQKLNTYNVLILLALAPGSICYGYTAAIIATTLGQPSFSEYFNLATRSNANALIGAMNGLFFTGGTIGPLFLPMITDRKGRIWGIAFSYILNIISAAFMAGSTNVGEFIFFRFVAGASAFMILGAIPLYMNEIVPPRMRGGLVELHAVFFILGFVIASWVGFGFSFWTTASLTAWRAPLAIQIFFPLIGLPCLYFMPESPRWLVLKGREAEAQAILHRLHGDSTEQGDLGARAEFYQIQKQLHIDKTLGNSWMHLLRKPSYRKRVLYACGLTFFIQSSGDLVINNYSPLLYKNLGYGLVKKLLYPSAWLTWTLGLAVIAIPLIDRFPRNKITAVGLWLAGLCLIIEAALVAEFVPSTNENALRAAVAMLFLFQIPDAIMLNGPEWAYLGEFFPTHIRSKGYCAAMSVLALSNIVYTTAAATAFANVGWKYYLLFIILTFIGGCVVWFYYPDTRFMPLEEIAAMFGDVDEVAVYQTEIEIDTAKNTITDHHDEKASAVQIEDAERTV